MKRLITFLALFPVFDHAAAQDSKQSPKKIITQYYSGKDTVNADGKDTKGNPATIRWVPSRPKVKMKTATTQQNGPTMKTLVKQNDTTLSFGGTQNTQYINIIRDNTAPVNFFVVGGEAKKTEDTVVHAKLSSAQAQTESEALDFDSTIDMDDSFRKLLDECSEDDYEPRVSSHYYAANKKIPLKDRKLFEQAFETDDIGVGTAVHLMETNDTALAPDRLNVLRLQSGTITITKEDKRWVAKFWKGAPSGKKFDKNANLITPDEEVPYWLD